MPEIGSRGLVICGADRLGQRFYAQLRGLGLERACHVAVDRSSDPGRVLRLVRRRRLSIPVVVRMAWAEWLRPRYPWPGGLDEIRSVADLTRLLERERPAWVLCYRAGLIVPRRILERGIPFYNLHAARLPDYGGLAAIARALAAGDLAQEATLHRMEARIDAGETLATEPYRLDPRASYRANEELAYAAGERLALRQLQELLRSPRSPRDG